MTKKLNVAGENIRETDRDAWLLILKRFDITYSDVNVWRTLGTLGFSSQKPEKRALERNEKALGQWKKRWPALKKSPERRPDESGLSERPTRVRTWAP